MKSLQNILNLRSPDVAGASCSGLSAVPVLDVAGASCSGEIQANTPELEAPATPKTNTPVLDVAGASCSGELKEYNPELEAPATFKSKPAIFFDRETLVIRQGENLPHWSCASAVYHVAFRLVDSVPASVRSAWRQERNDIFANAAITGRPLTEAEELRLKNLYSERIEKLLDAGGGACHLAKPEIASLIAEALEHFDKNRYSLHAWCIMPNHVHVMVEPLSPFELDDIVHSWKSFTAIKANRLLKLHGQFWQHEPYDHIIRTTKEYWFQVAYIWKNPEKAGLQNWPWRYVNEMNNVAGASCSGSSVVPVLNVAGASCSGEIQTNTPELEAPATPKTNTPELEAPATPKTNTPELEAPATSNTSIKNVAYAF